MSVCVRVCHHARRHSANSVWYKLGIKTISFVPFAIRSGWCNQTFSIALFPKGFSILMQSLGLFVTFTSIYGLALVKKMKLMRLLEVWFPCVMRIRIVFSLLVLTSKTNTVDNFCWGGEGKEKLKDFAAIVFLPLWCLIAFEGQNLMNL